MRILIVAPPWLPVPPPAYGGTETVLDGLARGLKAAGHEVLLYTTGEATCPVDRGWFFEQAIGVGVGGAAQEIRHVVHAYESAKDFDIVHDHTLIGPLYCERFPDLAVLTTNHGPFESDLIDLYRVTSHRVPVIAISHHQATGAVGVEIGGSDPPRCRRRVTFSSATVPAATPCSSAVSTQPKGHTSPRTLHAVPVSRCGSPANGASRSRSSTSSRRSSRCSVPTSSTSARSTTPPRSTCSAGRRCCSIRSPGPSPSAW